MSALQRKLGSASVQRKRHEQDPGDDHEEPQPRRLDGPWPPGYWQRCEEARANGWKPAPTRYPFLLAPDGPVSTPAELQALAGMEALYQ
ncbi:hypothetical protein C8A05DRAFT_34104 [Staphylotrichum tortipilum]|uniref:Uncharacterized protein n=1 Tax=Staphylotrichum tortipilum TaxID=2831512 RepID=A0AAN6MJT4_9PEZI|nr:hypothetical protein C8A05DRAFT_34104 [Staphylotrichum longicolle]